MSSNVEESYTEHLDTSQAVQQSLVTVNFDTGLDYAEITLDSFVTDVVLKEIPIVKSVVGVVRSGLKVKEIFFAKKILTFLKEFHSSEISEDKLYEFREKFKYDIAYREQVMEQIMVFNDKFIHVEKSRIFANLFAAYVNGKYGLDDMISLCMCVEMLNVFSVHFLHKMAAYEQPFNGQYYRDETSVPLLAAAGIVEVWGTHLSITAHGFYIYYYGILGKVNGDVQADYPPPPQALA
ncbi:hypothetical protein K3G63_06740 [Hymenobacter sp. HSC-4F20]|uniref:hypothetical protein n=1 Tax=Hymenobacter sp. HSC-4F20 TaxID=2864135 RepID=UPI001C72E65F|nr:hypothetical protein [Hymenobacter sp. HSC-4F20]MBX0290128.1 hypothetical protein [Hymenobacter sp. HSC-4F20]